MSELIIDDEYIYEMISFFQTTSQKAEQDLKQYLKEMDAISKTGIMDGNKADALKVFVERAEMLQNTIEEYGSLCVQLLKDFLEDIDRVDRYLY